LTQNNVILEKMDGSMVAPFLSEGKLLYASKNGRTPLSDIIQRYVDNGNTKYSEFSLKWISEDYSPIYEWCSPQSTIVLEYQEDQLILTALRNNASGEYVPYQDMLEAAAAWNIPVVKSWKGKLLESDEQNKFESFPEWILHMRSKVDLEGFVMRFEDGFMLKLKTEWYFALNKGLLQNMFTTERDLWLCILNNQFDDMKPVMKVAQKEMVDKFSEDLITAIQESATRISKEIEEMKKEFPDRRTFSGELSKRKIHWKPLYYDIFEGNDPLESSLDFVKKQLSSGKKNHDLIRPLCGNLKFDFLYNESDN